MEELKPVVSDDGSSEESSSDFDDSEDNEDEEERKGTEKPKESSPKLKEPLPDKPVDANSEIVPNKELTDEEIAQLILEEEELLPGGEQGVLG